MSIQSVEIGIGSPEELSIEVGKDGRVYLTEDGTRREDYRLEKQRRKILFHLAEVVRLQAFGNHFKPGTGSEEVSRLTMTRQGRRSTIVFDSRAIDSPPADVRRLVDEMSGVIRY